MISTTVIYPVKKVVNDKNSRIDEYSRYVSHQHITHASKSHQMIPKAKPHKTLVYFTTYVLKYLAEYIYSQQLAALNSKLYESNLVHIIKFMLCFCMVYSDHFQQTTSHLFYVEVEPLHFIDIIYLINVSEREKTLTFVFGFQVYLHVISCILKL